MRRLGLGIENERSDSIDGVEGGRVDVKSVPFLPSPLVQGKGLPCWILVKSLG